MPSLRAMEANSIMRVITSSCFFTGGIKAFAIALKLPRKVGRGVVYITENNVPPKTIRIEGMSINGPTPPPEIIAPIIMPTAPKKPINEAISMELSCTKKTQLINANSIPI